MSKRKKKRTVEEERERWKKRSGNRQEDRVQREKSPRELNTSLSERRRKKKNSLAVWNLCFNSLENEGLKESLGYLTKFITN